MYSDIINNPTNIIEKITTDKRKYFEFENTRLIADGI